MKLSASFLTMKEDRMNELINTPIDYIHVDVMDGVFVKNLSDSIYSVKEKLKDNTKKLDVHLMVKDVFKYVDDFKTLNPEYIIFHYEAVKDHMEVINRIKSLNIKVGIAINPGTLVDAILSFLDKIDLVLVMSVIPGKGGQSFINNSLFKIKRLNFLREINHFNYVIEVDGGVNDEVIKNLNGVDIVVAGNYITSADNYLEQVNKLKDNFPLA